MSIRLTTYANLTAFDAVAIGSKVTNPEPFKALVTKGIENHDASNDQAPGQHFIMLPPEVCEMVSAGVGQRTKNPEDYIVRLNPRGRVEMYLRRECAVSVTGCAVVVYTRDAFLADPDCQKPEERAAFEAIQANTECTHVIVAVLAFGGPKPALTPYRFAYNLAGGNNEALSWTADEIREKAKEVVAHEDEWCVVAD